MTSARRELMLSAVFFDFCFLLLATHLQPVEETDLCWCHRCAIFSVSAEYLFECAPALWMLLHLRFGGSKIVCAGKITSASAKPGPSALPHDAPLHMFQRPTFQLLYSSRSLYIRHFATTTSLLLFSSCSNARPAPPDSDVTVLGRKLAFRSDFGVHLTSSMLILLAYTRPSPLLPLYGPLPLLCTVSLL